MFNDLVNFLTRCEQVSYLVPMPLIEHEWRSRAGCRNLTVEESNDLFFVGRGGKSVKAQKFCTSSQCPVKRSCYYYAVLYDEKGIWAGSTEADRKNAPVELKKALHDEAVYYNTLENRDIESYIRAMRGEASISDEMGEVVQDVVEPVTTASDSKATVRELLSSVDSFFLEARAFLAT
jgi:hypothetical protein